MEAVGGLDLDRVGVTWVDPQLEGRAEAGAAVRFPIQDDAVHQVGCVFPTHVERGDSLVTVDGRAGRGAEGDLGGRPPLRLLIAL